MSELKKKGQQTLSASELAAKNLAQIQKIDPCASKILDKVPHTALYKFNREKEQWGKTDVDGIMFVYRRVDRPYYSLMIANRQSPSDYIEPITSSLKVSNENEYIFFCKEDETINGLWFYDKKDSQRIFKLIEKLIDTVSKSTTETPKKPLSSQQAPKSLNCDNRSAQLLELIKGGQSSVKSEKKESINPFPPRIQNSENNESVSAKGNEPVNTMPALLQKLMVQEQPRTIFKEPGKAISSDELEKDLINTAKPRNGLFQEFMNSPSAASLTAISNKSIQGSEGDPDVTEGENIETLETSFLIGSGNQTPVLSKDQFLSAITHLFQTDDQFVTQVHQAYVDALNRRLRLD